MRYNLLQCCAPWRENTLFQPPGLIPSYKHGEYLCHYFFDTVSKSGKPIFCPGQPAAAVGWCLLKGEAGTRTLEIEHSEMKRLI